MSLKKLAQWGDTHELTSAIAKRLPRLEYFTSAITASAATNLILNVNPENFISLSLDRAGEAAGLDFSNTITGDGDMTSEDNWIEQEDNTTTTDYGPNTDSRGLTGVRVRAPARTNNTPIRLKAIIYKDVK